METKKEITIKISSSAVDTLEYLAKDKGVTVDTFVEDLLHVNRNGIPFDVNSHSLEDCINVSLDLIKHLDDKHEKMSKLLTLTAKEMDDLMALGDYYSEAKGYFEDEDLN